MLKGLHKNKHVNEPSFGAKAQRQSEEGGEGRRGIKAPANRKIGMLKTWRGRAWDTSEYSDAQHPKFKLGSVVSDYRYRPRVFGSNRILRATGDYPDDIVHVEDKYCIRYCRAGTLRKVFVVG